MYLFPKIVVHHLYVFSHKCFKTKRVFHTHVTQSLIQQITSAFNTSGNIHVLSLTVRKETDNQLTPSLDERLCRSADTQQ